jgi:hypothetical protein
MPKGRPVREHRRSSLYRIGRNQSTRRPSGLKRLVPASNRSRVVNVVAFGIFYMPHRRTNHSLTPCVSIA